MKSCKRNLALKAVRKELKKVLEDKGGLEFHLEHLENLISAKEKEALKLRKEISDLKGHKSKTWRGLPII